MLKLKEDAAFMRCVDVMARLIEKYGNEEDTYKNEETEKEEVAS